MSKIYESIGSAGKREQDSAIKNRVLLAMREENPLYEFLEFYGIVGRSDKPQKGSAATGGNQRAINSGFANNPVDPAFGDVNLKIYGDDIRTDKAWNRSAEGEALRQHIRDIVEFSHSLGRHILDHLVNGDIATSALQFDGLKVQTPAGNTNTLYADNGTDGLQLLTGNTDAAVKSQQKLVEAIGKAIKNSRATYGIANGDIIERSKVMLPANWTQRTVNGHTIDYFNNTPIIDIGTNKDESAEILPFSETVGVTADCGSMYFVKAGERKDASLATSIGMDVGQLYEDKNFLVNQIEMDLDLVLLSSKCVERVAGLRLG